MEENNFGSIKGVGYIKAVKSKINPQAPPEERDRLLFYIYILLIDPRTPEETKIELQEALNYLAEHLTDLEVRYHRGMVRIKVLVYPEGDEEVKKQINYYFNKPVIESILGIITIPKSKKKPSKKTKIRSGGHLIDNILKGGHPVQLTIFDSLLQETQDRILSTGASIDLINRKGEGIKLSKGETRLLLCLANLLHKKSQTEDKKAEDYYTGKKGEIIKWKIDGETVEAVRPYIGFTLYEIAKEFYGDEAIGGENVRIVSKILYDLAEDPNKRALMRYTRVVDMGKNKTREYFIERYDSLITIATAGYKDLLNGKQIDEKRELVVGLHPIFIDQIADKYIELPLDLTQRLIEAHGSPNISEITTKLILELYRAHSNRKRLTKDQEGNPIYQIAEEKLFYKIAEDYMPPNRRRIPLIKDYLDKSIAIAKKIGLLQGYEIKPGATGENIYYFTLRKKWE